MVEEIINNKEDDNELKSLTFDEIIEGDKERKQWTERSDLWFISSLTALLLIALQFL